MFQIDHLGIAVRSEDAAKAIYEKLGLVVSPGRDRGAEKGPAGHGSHGQPRGRRAGLTHARIEPATDSHG